VHAPTLVERIEMPPLGEFVDRYVRHSRPVILAGAARDWPARTRWTPEELGRRFADRAVPVACHRTTNGYYDTQGLSHSYDPMPMREYLDAVAARRTELYMVFRTQEYLPELLDDVRLPDVCARAKWFGSRFWFAMADVGGPLHADLPHNLYAQVVGRKNFLLAHYYQTARVYPFAPWSGAPNYSRVDAERPDIKRFPRFAGVKLKLAELEPGDMLYIPSLYWHQARALTDSVSINLWWANGVLREVIRAAEWFMRLRSLKW
jgi:lysine-specific demethylase 8